MPRPIELFEFMRRRPCQDTTRCLLTHILDPEEQVETVARAFSAERTMWSLNVPRMDVTGRRPSGRPTSKQTETGLPFEAQDS